ncbi:hypothetical protein GLOIN_2v1687743 [Rhizophagus irregularis DAOM 181602=DAOM 197198]|uniref:Uncharacterized protein n=1 Tax=Rhizophagus irregularis (strain DAOM 181602 / DAOM 197198 / MUCL 43194) TaxID=747089 RepID=A0A2P4PCZ4_RHIID|nr:hypothetical protein GLOIN_2v1687743 [Rhizophagus irregularis DAOM 181602=DAOM 197198]POG63254.1 hypothetical protein GLOIN_2v1687743 [Rhizophagus irregularis DAOM 181602=DAOM 197198]|eukprot:XP_025170120.1 hypothetical protein GLOIN_2v1687743 [Rhizophagus irregularis DAOM 181602=DAOM 197198]
MFLLNKFYIYSIILNLSMTRTLKNIYFVNERYLAHILIIVTLHDVLRMKNI